VTPLTLDRLIASNLEARVALARRMGGAVL